ncbi:MAG: hypothetical protein ABEK01_05695 [Candidatus Nanohaloarchaea archaeon]
MSSESGGLDYLSQLERSPNKRYESRAVFGDEDSWAEVREYDNLEVYEWEADSDFRQLLDAIEPLYPLSQDPGLEMVREKGRVRDADDDHVELSNEYVYDPVAEWRGKDRWSEYSLIQVNLNGAKVAYDEKEGFPRVRVFSSEWGPQVFEELFPETVEDSSAGEIVREVSEVY